MNNYKILVNFGQSSYPDRYTYNFWLKLRKKNDILCDLYIY